MQEDFKKIADMFFSTVTEKDFEKFKSYLSPELGFFAILPDGKTYHDVPSFIENQKTWFHSKGGSFTYKIDKVFQKEDLAYASIYADYKNKDNEGKDFHLALYISTVFQLKNKNWYAILDQNTLISKK
jgi:ketosteroid isomerase-like protein